MGKPPQSPAPRTWATVGLLRSLPLLVTAALCAILGGAVLRVDPRYGPGAFTLWALLFLIGIVCSIGGIASWLLVEDGDAPARNPSGARDEPTPRSRAYRVPHGGRTAAFPAEFGRPRPDAARSRLPRWVPPAAVGPLRDHREPSRAPPEEEGQGRGAGDDTPPARDLPVDVLRDLDRIERELAPRPQPRRPTASPGG